MQLRAKVKAVVALGDFSGKAFPADIDLHFAVTVHIVSIVPAWITGRSRVLQLPLIP
jgi:hypothetical protein